MTPFGWVRPFRREFWRVMPVWRRAHRLMGNQAMALGASTLTVEIALGLEDWLFPTLFITAAMVLYGNLVEQPEVHDEQD